MTLPDSPLIRRFADDTQSLRSVCRWIERNTVFTRDEPVFIQAKSGLIVIVRPRIEVDTPCAAGSTNEMSFPFLAGPESTREAPIARGVPLCGYEVVGFI